MTQTNASQAAALLALGAQNHQEGRLEMAMDRLSQAYRLDPHNLQIVFGLAAVWLDMKVPAEAIKVLQLHETEVLATADGCFNYAVVSEMAGERDKAVTLYQAALKLNPANVLAMQNLAVLFGTRRNPAATREALQLTREALRHAPGQAVLHANLSEFHTVLREFKEALTCLREAMRLAPENKDWQAQYAILLAFDGQLAEARTALAKLGDKAPGLLHDLLVRSTLASDRRVTKQPIIMPDVDDMYLEQALEALRRCDWREQAKHTTHLRGMVAQTHRQLAWRDWRDAQFFGLMLDMPEHEQVSMVAATRRTGIKFMEGFSAVGLPRRAVGAAAKRTRIGILAQTFDDPRYLGGLVRQLQAHDRSKYHITVYSPTPKPLALLDRPVEPHCDALVHIVGLQPVERVKRVLLDRQDMLLDQTFYTPWCHSEFFWQQVAMAQARQLTWHRLQGLPDYQLSDTFIHPDGLDLMPYGAVVRLPRTAWLSASPPPQADTSATREAYGLPPTACVFSAFNATVKIDPDTFAAWLRILRAVPDAVLWLNQPPAECAEHLLREVHAAGIAPARLVFAQGARRAQHLADVFLDTWRFNANQTLVDALSMGVPALSVAGFNMASRLGGSILRAAGFRQGIMGDRASYERTAIALGQDPSLRAQWRTALAHAAPTAPLFDFAGQIRDLERAIDAMVDRAHDGLAPGALDIA
jgi:protein O-GlcNAc transferase